MRWTPYKVFGMTLEQINKLNPDTPESENWDTAIEFIRERFHKRYFNQIQILQDHPNKEISNNCGFIMLSVDCIVIEVLQQFYDGTDESHPNTTDAYLKFFRRNAKWSDVINTQLKAREFANQIRAGLLHQAKTKEQSILNKKRDTPIIDWIDATDITKGLIINRDLFHKEVMREFESYLELVKTGKTSVRLCCIKKLLTIVID
jgi:hypothetical protein